MNKQRRKQIDEVYASLEQWVGVIEGLQSEEQESFDAMPEGLQESERGQAASEAADSLGEALDYVNSALEALEAAKGEG